MAVTPNDNSGQMRAITAAAASDTEERLTRIEEQLAGLTETGEKVDLIWTYLADRGAVPTLENVPVAIRDACARTGRGFTHARVTIDTRDVLAVLDCEQAGDPVTVWTSIRRAAQPGHARPGNRAGGLTEIRHTDKLAAKVIFIAEVADGHLILTFNRDADHHRRRQAVREAWPATQEPRGALPSVLAFITLRAAAARLGRLVCHPGGGVRRGTVAVMWTAAATSLAVAVAVVVFPRPHPVPITPAGSTQPAPGSAPAIVRRVTPDPAANPAPRGHHRRHPASRGHATPAPAGPAPTRPPEPTQSSGPPATRPHPRRREGNTIIPPLPGGLPGGLTDMIDPSGAPLLPVPVP